MLKQITTALIVLAVTVLMLWFAFSPLLATRAVGSAYMAIRENWLTKQASEHNLQYKFPRIEQNGWVARPSEHNNEQNPR
jgi:hypothetical protein